MKFNRLSKNVICLEKEMCPKQEAKLHGGTSNAESVPEGGRLGPVRTLPKKKSNVA